MELTIEEIGGRGDGYSKLEGRPLFVPLTVPGDRVRARVVSETAAGFRGELVELLSPNWLPGLLVWTVWGLAGGATVVSGVQYGWRTIAWLWGRED